MISSVYRAIRQPVGCPEFKSVFLLPHHTHTSRITRHMECLIDEGPLATENASSVRLIQAEVGLFATVDTNYELGTVEIFLLRN